MILNKFSWKNILVAFFVTTCLFCDMSAMRRRRSGDLPEGPSVSEHQEAGEGDRSAEVIALARERKARRSDALARVQDLISRQDAKLQANRRSLRQGLDALRVRSKRQELCDQMMLVFVQLQDYLQGLVYDEVLVALAYELLLLFPDQDEVQEASDEGERITVPHRIKNLQQQFDQFGELLKDVQAGSPDSLRLHLYRNLIAVLLRMRDYLSKVPGDEVLKEFGFGLLFCIPRRESMPQEVDGGIIDKVLEERVGCFGCLANGARTIFKYGFRFALGSAACLFCLKETFDIEDIVHKQCWPRSYYANSTVPPM